MIDLRLILIPTLVLNPPLFPILSSILSTLVLNIECKMPRLANTIASMPLAFLHCLDPPQLY